MSKFEKNLKSKDVVLDADGRLPSGSRSQKNVARIIAAVRAAEMSYLAEVSEKDDIILKMTFEIQELKGKLLKYQMGDKLESYPQLSVQDRSEILSVADEVVKIEESIPVA